MADPKKAWVLIYKNIDPSRETNPSVYLDKKKAEEDLAYGISVMANSLLLELEFEQEVADELRSIIKANGEKRFEDAISEWDVWKGDHGPLDEDTEMLEADLVE